MLRRSTGGFTLLELMTAVMIMGILVLILAQAGGDLRNRADFSKCVMNMRSLYVGAGNYVQEQGRWPQISARMLAGKGDQYAEAWYQALKKFGISREGWVCPTVQRQLKFPDLEKGTDRRVDYIATPFDSNQFTPYRWGTQPWFIEKSSSHPKGNLVIYADGQILPLKEAVKRTARGQ